MAYENNRGGNQAPRERTVMDDPRISMSTKCPSAPGKWSSWRWTYGKNMFGVIVWTNDPADEKKFISVNLPPTDFDRYLALLQQAIDYPETGDHKGYMDVKEKKWIQAQNKFSDEPLLQGTIIVGKKDGVVWQSVLSFDKERPKIRFPFGNTMYNELRKGTGEPMTDAEISVLGARAILNFLLGVKGPLAVANYKHKEKTPDGGGQRQGGGSERSSGGYSNQASGGGGSSSKAVEPAEAMDDDIPW